MLVAAKDLQTHYEKALDSASITRELRPHFRKWLRFRTFTTVEVKCAAFHGQARRVGGVPPPLHESAPLALRCPLPPNSGAGLMSIRLTPDHQLLITINSLVVAALAKETSQSTRFCVRARQPSNQQLQASPR
jgi:hypothetical protein